MVKIGGGGPKAPDTSGVQRAHESVMRSHEAGAQQAAQMGQTVGGIVDDVRQQGQVDADQQARKDRLDVEMAKGDLEFQGEGVGRKVGTTAEGLAKEQRSEDRADLDAVARATKANAYAQQQRIGLIKAGYSSTTGEVTEEGKRLLRNLSREPDRFKSYFSGLAAGGAKAEKALKAVAADPDLKGAFAQGQMTGAPATGEQNIGPAPGVSAGEAGISTQPGGDIGYGSSQMGDIGMDLARALPLVRAALDYSQLKFTRDSGGELPEDVMMDSKAWQNFNSARVNFIAIVKSGVMMPVAFSNVKERNRFFNELAADHVLSGQPAPGALADPGMMEGAPPAGTPDDGNQQPAGPPGSHSSVPGTSSSTETGPGGYGYSTSSPNSGG